MALGTLLGYMFVENFAFLGSQIETGRDDMAFMPQFAPIVVLLFLGTCAALALAGLAALYGFSRKKPLVWKWAIGFALLLVAGYAGVLLVASLASSERVLARGQKKYFCEIDCHIAYAIEGVSTASALGPELQIKAPDGKFLIVTVKTWFDENTISPHRGNGSLTPNPRRVILADDRGREFQPWDGTPPALEQRMGGHRSPASRSLSEPLRPGESYVSELVFDVPSGVHNLRLLITDQELVTRLLIGHEASPFHKKIWFEVGAYL